MDNMHPVIKTFFIPILFVSSGPMKLKRINKSPPGKSTDAEMIGEW